jgi:hypothetical protein
MVRPELSFDGKGINGPDEYRTRVATFGHLTDDAQVTKYGKLFAASPDLLASAFNFEDLADEVEACLTGDTLEEFQRIRAMNLEAIKAAGGKP